jgi:hypothetical protein
METQKSHHWVTGKAIQRRKFIAINVYIKREELSQLNSLILNHKELGKEYQNKLEILRNKLVKN